MKVFNHILQGHEATEENARDHARGFDWSEVETREQDRPEHSQFFEHIQGISIWYDYGADYYFFQDDPHNHESGDGQTECLKCIEELEEMTEEQKEAFKEDLSDSLNRSGMYKQLKDLAVTHAGKNISNDSEVWHEIEELIIEKLLSAEGEQI